MPIIRLQSKLFLFAHIPKCGGHSIERYFRDNYPNSLGFYDWHYFINPPKIPYSISSPQHIDGESLKRIFPNNFFDHRFALVRHPLRRLESAFLFNKYKLGRIDKGVYLNDFIANYLPKIAITHGLFDNHFLPQVRFFDPSSEYHIFKLENNGIERAKTWVEAAALQTPTNKKIGHLNKNSFGKPERMELNTAAKEIVEEIYFEDFKRFQY